MGASTQGSGTLNYWWPRPSAKEASEELAYVRRSSAWNRYMIAGDYVDDIQHAFNAALVKSLALLTLVA